MNDFSTDKCKNFITLGFILLFGVILRFLLLNTYYFMPENHSLYDFTLLSEIIAQGKAFYAGRVSSIAGFRYSPLYHFMIYPIFYFFENEFLGMMLFTFLLDVGSLLIFFYLGLRYLKKAYLLPFSLLLFFGFYEVTELLTLWAVNTIPFFAALSFLALVKIFEEGRDRWFVVLGFCVSCFMQIHTTGYVFFVYMLSLFFIYRRKFNLLWLLLGILLFLFCLVPVFLQQGETVKMNYLALAVGLFNKCFSFWKYKMTFTHSMFEYLYAGLYFAGILNLLFAGKEKSIFVSEKIFKMFKVYAWFVFLYIFFYVGDIFQIYLYRGFNFIAFVGILMFLNRFEKGFRVLFLYAFINVMIFGSIAFGKNDSFVDFRDRSKLSEFLLTEKAAEENIFKLSRSYRQEIIVGWYKYLMDRTQEQKGRSQDFYWVITEGSEEKSVVLDAIDKDNFKTFGNIGVFKFTDKDYLLLKEKIQQNKSGYYLYGFDDFGYELAEMEYLWKH